MLSMANPDVRGGVLVDIERMDALPRRYERIELDAARVVEMPLALTIAVD